MSAGPAGGYRFVGWGGACSGDEEICELLLDNGSVVVSAAFEQLPRTYRLGGTILASASSTVDGDVNDPRAPFVPNDVLSQAQPIGNPVTLGGYLNVAGSGPAGRSQVDGDETDLFRIALTAGQRISLFIAGDGLSQDLDLYLLNPDGSAAVDADGEPVQSTSDGPEESMRAPVSGEFVIEVRAQNGAATYLLVVSQRPAATPASPPVAQFVPGELIVTMRGEGRRGAAGGGSGQARLVRAFGGGRLPLGLGDFRRRVLDGVSARQQLRLDTWLAAKRLRLRRDVAGADLNFVRQTAARPDDPLYPRQWHYPLISLPQAWDVTTGSGTVVVAVLDTGIVSTHPDLQGRLEDGYDFISDPLNAADGDGIDPDPEDPGDGGPFQRDSFHGTHVTGILAAASGNGVGVAGVAPGVAVMPLRVLGARGGTDYDLIQALRYAGGLSNDSGRRPARRADTINMSLGGPGLSQALRQTLQELRSRGIILVAAGGNGASSAPFYPAAHPEVVGVSAVDIRAQPAPYSNYGAGIAVAAPGGTCGRM